VGYVYVRGISFWRYRLLLQSQRQRTFAVVSARIFVLDTQIEGGGFWCLCEKVRKAPERFAFWFLLFCIGSEGLGWRGVTKEWE